MLATRNPGKIREFQAFLQPLGIRVDPLPADAPECPETGDTFAENARIKAETIMRRYQMPVLADDSGLQVDALQGAPGVYSARYAGEHATDEENLQKLLSELSGIAVDWKHCSARFVCVLAFARPAHPTLYITGICEGRIIQSPRGEGGFGYDPVFWLPEQNRTMAELAIAEKNAVSHRAKALQQFAVLLQKTEGS